MQYVSPLEGSVNSFTFSPAQEASQTPVSIISVIGGTAGLPQYPGGLIRFILGCGNSSNVGLGQLACLFDYLVGGRK